MRRFALLAAATLALAGAASAAKLDKAVQTEIKRILEVVKPTGDIFVPMRFGELAKGQSLSVAFDGDHLHEYYINSYCDDDCGNLDLRVTEASGAEIDLDDADDNAPVLNIHADDHDSDDNPKARPRPMVIEIRMVDCKAATCAFGIVITRTE